MDFRAVTGCHRESAISMCPRFLNAMTRDVPSERLPKLDVAGSNPVGRSKNSRGYGETRNPFSI